MTGAKRDDIDGIDDTGRLDHDVSSSRQEEAAFGLPRPSRTLTALAGSALALPGIAGSARADAPIERATASFASSYYFEDDLKNQDFDSTTGSQDRYEVVTQQLRFDLPVSDRVDIGLDLLYEEMSGASPWFVRAGSDGTPLQVMSGATIEDTRVDAALDYDFYMDNGKDTLSHGFSKEKDYLSIHFGLGTERNYNDKNTVFNLGFAFSYDWIDPTDPELSSARPESEEKWSIDLFAGISQVLTRSTVVQFTMNYKHSDGYLSDPYKAITDIASTGVYADVRPDTKDQVSLMARVRHHFESLNGSLHGDYRFYADDWGVVSHTLEAAWYQRFFDWLTVAPSLRWYSQSKADFYEAILPAAPTAGQLRTSDYRQSPYGAVAARIKFEAELIDLFEYDAPPLLRHIGINDGFDLIAAITYERYISDGHFSVSSVIEADEAPGLVNFQVVAVTLSGRF